jgi:hypothetical protein
VARTFDIWAAAVRFSLRPEIAAFAFHRTTTAIRACLLQTKPYVRLGGSRAVSGLEVLDSGAVLVGSWSRCPLGSPMEKKLDHCWTAALDAWALDAGSLDHCYFDGRATIADQRTTITIHTDYST